MRSSSLNLKRSCALLIEIRQYSEFWMSKNCRLWPTKSGLGICLKCLCFGEWMFCMLSAQPKLVSCCHAILQIQCKLYCDWGSDAWHVGSIIECKFTWYILDWSGFIHCGNRHSIWWSIDASAHSNSINTTWMITLVLKCTMIWHAVLPLISATRTQTCLF
jgi:hypothetical protein